MLATLIWRDPFFRETARYSLQGIALFPIVATLVFTTQYRVANVVLNSSLAVWIGQLSYSLYVWHQGIADLLEPLGWGTPLAFTLASLFVATASFYLVEKPFLQLRKRLRPRACGGELGPAHTREAVALRMQPLATSDA